MTTTNKLRNALLLGAATATLGSLGLRAQTTLTLDNDVSIVRETGETVDVQIGGPANEIAALMLDASAGPTNILGLNVPLGLTPAFALAVVGLTSGSGTLDTILRIPHAPQLHGQTYYLAALVTDPSGPNGLSVSNGTDLSIVARPQLAGNSLADYPFFEHVAAINRQSSVELGIDPRYTFVAGKTADIYVVASRTASQWDGNPALVDVRGGPQTETFAPGATSIQDYTFTLDTGALLGPDESPSSGDTRTGIGYDVVIDFGQDGNFDEGIDLIDGYDEQEAGFYVMRDMARGGIVNQAARGPYAVTEINYSGGSFLAQNTYYPSNIASLGALPLVVVSHGNGTTTSGTTTSASISRRTATS